MGRREVVAVDGTAGVGYPAPLEEAAGRPDQAPLKSEAEKWPTDPVFSGVSCFRCGQPKHQWHRCADLLPDWRPEPLYAVTSAHITKTLLFTGGGINAAARLLGLTPGKMKEKMRRYGIVTTTVAFQRARHERLQREGR